MRPLRLAVVATLLFGLPSSAHAAPAHAPEDKQRAAQSFAVAEGAFARGEFAVAGAAFEQAALYASHPATLLNAAEAWELAGHPSRAAQLCDRVLDTPGAEPKYRDVARQRLARVEPKIGTITVDARGLRVTLDDGVDDVSGQRVRLAAGIHAVTVTDPSSGEARVQKVVAVAGEAKTVRFALRDERAPAPRPEPVVEASAAPPLATWLAFGIGAVAAGAGSYFAFRTVDAKDRFDEAPSIGAKDDFYAARTATNVAFVVAGVAVVTGSIVWLVAPKTKATTTTRARTRTDAVAPALLRF